MNVMLPEVFDLSSLSRALDEDIAAQEKAAIDCESMDVDDEWAPAPCLWYNPEPQPAWNNLELELENSPVENVSLDVPGWYVNLRGPNDQSSTWRNLLPAVSVQRVKTARMREAPTPTPTPPVSAPRPWYNPEPQPAWNNLELELENPSVKNAPQAQNQDLPGWHVKLWGPNDQLRPIWRNAPTPSAPHQWHNPEPQPAWNNLELELENSPVKNVAQDVPGWYINPREQNDQPRPTWRNLLPVVSVRRVKNAHVREALTHIPTLVPRLWHNSEPQPAWNNLELELENPSVENAPQVQNQDVLGWYANLRGPNDKPHPAGRNLLPMVSVRRMENARVRKATAPSPVLVVSARKEEKACLPSVVVSVIKGRAPVAPTSARKAGKARVPGILASTRKAEKARAPGIHALVRNTEKEFVLDVSASARKLEKAPVPPSLTPSPRVPAPSKSTSAHPKPVIPLHIDLSNMSSSSKVKLEDMPNIDEHPVQMRISWPMLAYTIQPVPPKVTSFHHQRHSPITRAHQSPANEDLVMFDNDNIDPTVSVPTTEDDTTSNNTRPTHLTDRAQPVADHGKGGEPTVEHKAAVEDDVDASDAKEGDSSSVGNAEETGEEDSEEAGEETEDESKARVAHLMTEVFGDGEDSDDEEPPLTKDMAEWLDHPSTSATSDSLTVDATESITDWSLDTPDDVGTEDNENVGVTDRDEGDEERRANYRAQLLANIFGNDVKGGKGIQEAPLVRVLVPTRDPRKRKRDDDAPPAPLVIRNPRKRRREADTVAIPSLATKDCRKRKHEDELPPALSLVTRDFRKRLKG